MLKKWIGSLVFSIFVIALTANPVTAGIKEGNFIPCSKNNSISTDSRVIFHRIAKGDTLWDISRTYKVDLQTIMSINSLDRKSVLTIGQTIEIPYSRSRVHIIRSGETMWDIAARYDIRVEDLKDFNADKNPRTLKIGDKLAIPESTFRTAMATAEPSRSISAGKNYFAWPLVGTITSNYGWRKSGFHHGIDIAGNIGDPVKASASGKVSFANYKSIYGRTVILDHDDSSQTVYAHLQKINVKKGQKVSRGQVIGTVGLTGRTTGPHLHFEIKKDNKTRPPLQFLRY